MVSRPLYCVQFLSWTLCKHWTRCNEHPVVPQLLSLKMHTLCFLAVWSPLLPSIRHIVKRKCCGSGSGSSLNTRIWIWPDRTQIRIQTLRIEGKLSIGAKLLTNEKRNRQTIWKSYKNIIRIYNKTVRNKLTRIRIKTCLKTGFGTESVLRRGLTGTPPTPPASSKPVKIGLRSWGKNYSQTFPAKQPVTNCIRIGNYSRSRPFGNWLALQDPAPARLFNRSHSPTGWKCIGGDPPHTISSPFNWFIYSRLLCSEF